MLGGQELVEIGLGDDQESQGYRQAYLSGWAQNVLQEIKGLAGEGQSSCVPVNLRKFEE